MRWVASAFATACLVAAPASAATYVGTLNGTITSGTATYSNTNPDPDLFGTTVIDLIGKPIQINFSVDVTLNYYDPVDDLLYPKYVVGSVDVIIPIPAPLGNFGSTQSNNVNNFGFADFTGNARNGSVIVGGLIGDPDFSNDVRFTFASASSSGGPLTGSGTASASFYNGRDFLAYYGLAFNLTSGAVSGPVPEPASWALMIVGVGATGAIMRRRRKAGPAAPRLPA